MGSIPPIILFGAGLALLSGLWFWLGYDTARKRKESHYRTIGESYLLMIKRTEEMIASDPGIAHAKGFKEGYRRGLEDSYATLQTLMETEFGSSIP